MLVCKQGFEVGFWGRVLRGFDTTHQTNWSASFSSSASYLLQEWVTLPYSAFYLSLELNSGHQICEQVLLPTASSSQPVKRLWTTVTQFLYWTGQTNRVWLGFRSGELKSRIARVGAVVPVARDIEESLCWCPPALARLLAARMLQKMIKCLPVWATDILHFLLRESPFKS